MTVVKEANEVERVTGWKPPIVYDISTDSYRIATQADIYEFVEMARAYGQMRDKIREIEAIHKSLCATSAKLRGPTE